MEKNSMRSIYDEPTFGDDAGGGDYDYDIDVNSETGDGNPNDHNPDDHNPDNGGDNSEDSDDESEDSDDESKDRGEEESKDRGDGLATPDDQTNDRTRALNKKIDDFYKNRQSRIQRRMSTNPKGGDVGLDIHDGKSEDSDVGLDIHDEHNKIIKHFFSFIKLFVQNNSRYTQEEKVFIERLNEDDYIKDYTENSIDDTIKHFFSFIKLFVKNNSYYTLKEQIFINSLDIKTYTDS